MKFENGLHREIKLYIGYLEIRQFSLLDNNCRIYEEDSKETTNHYKIAIKKKGKNQDRGKPYQVSVDKEKQKFKQEAAGGKETSGGDTQAPLRCFNCGVVGHCASECESTRLKSSRCGGQGHRPTECKNVVKCYNCNELGNISAQCQKPKKEKSGRKVFALSGTDVSGSGN